MDFKAEDFSTVSKELLHKLLDDEERCGWVILLCGVADMKAEIPRLETFLIDETKYPSEYRYKTQSWAARKARARMGVIEDIQRCIELVESELDLQIRLTYLKDLQYIRQPQIVDILHRYLNSNEEVPPMEEWGVKRLKGVGFAQYAAVSLAEILRGFPIKKHLGGYSKDDIERCRQWMSEQKGYEIIR